MAALPCVALTLLTHVFLAQEAVDDAGARPPPRTIADRTRRTVRMRGLQPTGSLNSQVKPRFLPGNFGGCERSGGVLDAYERELGGGGGKKTEDPIKLPPELTGRS